MSCWVNNGSFQKMVPYTRVKLLVIYLDKNAAEGSANNPGIKWYLHFGIRLCKHFEKKNERIYVTRGSLMADFRHVI